jgi:hypothetical protein
MIVPTATSATAAFSAFQSSGLYVLSHAPDRTLRQYPGTDMFRAGSPSSCPDGNCSFPSHRSDQMDASIKPVNGLRKSMQEPSGSPLVTSLGWNPEFSVQFGQPAAVCARSLFLVIKTSSVNASALQIKKPRARRGFNAPRSRSLACQISGTRVERQSHTERFLPRRALSSLQCLGDTCRVFFPFS